MERAKAASDRSFGLGGGSASTSMSTTTDLEKGAQQPNRNMAGLSDLVKDRKPEEEVKHPDESNGGAQDLEALDSDAWQLDSAESEGNEEETTRLKDASKKTAVDDLGEYAAVNMNQTNYSIE
jgi:hypothetical protein